MAKHRQRLSTDVIFLLLMLALLAWWNWIIPLVLTPFILYHAHKRKYPDHRRDGFIYFLLDDDDENVKIGRSKESPDLVVKDKQLMGYYKTRNMFEEEKTLHRLLAGCHVHGSWFDYECASRVLHERSELASDNGDTNGPTG